MGSRHRRAPGEKFNPEPAAEFRSTADLQEYLMGCRRPGCAILVAIVGLVLLILAPLVAQL